MPYFAHKILGNHEEFERRQNKGGGGKSLSLSKLSKEHPVFHIQLYEKTPIPPCGPLKQIVGNRTFPLYEKIHIFHTFHTCGGN